MLSGHWNREICERIERRVITNDEASDGELPNVEPGERCIMRRIICNHNVKGVPVAFA